MLLVDTWIAFLQNILIVGLILIFQTYIIEASFNVKPVGVNCIRVFLWASVYLVLSDFTLLLMSFSQIFWRKRRYKLVTKNAEDISIFMLLSSLEVMVFSVGTYIGQLIIRVVTGNFSQQTITLYANEIAITGTIMGLIINVGLFWVIRANRAKINSVKSKIKQLSLDTEIFWFLFGLLFSLEFIITMSDLQGITASIQAALIMIFSILLSISYWQISLFLKTYTIRQEAISQFVRNQQLQDYLVNIEQQYTELRRFKHDYQNILLSLESFAEKGDQQQFKAYYQELLAQRPIQSEIQGAVIAQLDYLKNDPIRGLVIQKFLAAKQAGVTLKFEMTEPIELPSANLLTVIRIIGILLDNAIEQAVQETDKLVSCAFLQSEGLIEITIENTASQVKDIQAFSELGYSTKGAGRGTGLANVQDLIAKQTNLFLETQIENRKLRQTLMITEET